jgi:hypothetical protein
MCVELSRALRGLEAAHAGVALGFAELSSGAARVVQALHTTSRGSVTQWGFSRAVSGNKALDADPSDLVAHRRFGGGTDRTSCSWRYSDTRSRRISACRHYNLNRWCTGQTCLDLSHAGRSVSWHSAFERQSTQTPVLGSQNICAGHAVVVQSAPLVVGASNAPASLAVAAGSLLASTRSTSTDANGRSLPQLPSAKDIGRRAQSTMLPVPQR